MSNRLMLIVYYCWSMGTQILIKQYNCGPLVYESCYWQHTVSVMQMLLRNFCVSSEKFKMLDQFLMSIRGRKEENLDFCSNSDYTKAD